jgi:hypothetical protein
VSEDHATVELTFPLDSGGFLRRECPTCEREFKWRPTPDGAESIPAADGGYFCPYCGVQASPDTWFTPAQLEYGREVASARLVGPMLKGFVDGINRSGGASRGLKFSASSSSTSEPEPLTEADDMVRVDFSCHPTEPVKVTEGWSVPVHCLVCGSASS